MVIVDYQEFELINCSCNYANGANYDKSKPLVISTDDGFSFDIEMVYKIRGYDAYGSHQDFTLINDGITLTLNDDYYNDWGEPSSIYDDFNTILLINNFIAIGEAVEKITFTNIYLMTIAELNELSQIRYLDSTVNYGEFIVSLYKLPYKIVDELVVKEKTNVRLGNEEIEVKSSLITTDKLIIDFGDIVVAEKYHNIYDFINTSCILHLPYFDNIYIDVEYVVGQTINIKYVIDLYSGECSVNIYSSFLGDIVETRQNNIVQSIPFIQNKYNSIVGSLSSVNKNLIDKPFIEVVRNIPYNKSANVFGNNVVEYGKIEDYTGYLQCDKIVLETNATNQEQEEIKNILRNGVFIYNANY